VRGVFALCMRREIEKSKILLFVNGVFVGNRCWLCQSDCSDDLVRKINKLVVLNWYLVLDGWVIGDITTSWSEFGLTALLCACERRMNSIVSLT
jgi:hypothetical protein